MPQHQYPGVYVTEVSTPPHPIPGVPTSTSGIIGAETIARFQRLIEQVPQDWTDANQHDPGIALLELAAWLAESLAFRAEQVPDKAALASARLVLASLALASERRQPNGSAIERVRFFEGQILDDKDTGTEVDTTRCLKIVRQVGRTSPLETSRYQIFVDGALVAGFQDADGLSLGGAGGFFERLITRRVRKLLGLRKYTTIVLKRGHAADRTLADWYRNVQAGRSDRRAMVIKHTERSFRSEWHVDDAGIEKFEGPCLNAAANDVEIESLELAHDGLRIGPP